MNLSDFENYIDDRILGRGWEYYYRYECIKSITKEDESPEIFSTASSPVRAISVIYPYLFRIFPLFVQGTCCLLQ